MPVRQVVVMILIFLATALYAAPVLTTEAQDIAKTFLSKAQTTTVETSALDSSIQPPFAPPPPITIEIQSITPNLGANNAVDFYTIRFKGGGFVLLSAEDKANPILGFSLNSSLPDTLNNLGFQQLLTEYHNQIQHSRVDSIVDMVIANKWNILRYEAGHLSFSAQDTLVQSADEIKATLSDPAIQKMVYANIMVAPLMKTTWNQGSPWNLYAPTASGGPGGKAYAGCVATAMGQIMKYYEYPASGSGVRNGRDFSMNQYSWSNMPLNSSTESVALILRDAGAAVDMQYGAGGSGASPSLVSNAFNNYFRYKNSHLVARSQYSNSGWDALMKAELNAQRPVFYSGYNSSYSSGHAFVLDGYMSNDYFHYNFGWSGQADGWFSTSLINPSGMNFTTGQLAVIGIEPDQYKKGSGKTIAGIMSTGETYISGDLKTLSPSDGGNKWTTLSAALKTFVLADLDGDGKKNEIVGISTKGYLAYSINGTSFVTTTKALRTVGVADLNGDQKDDIFGLDGSYNVISSVDLGVTWSSFKSSLTSLFAQDLNKDGIVDFYGLTSAGKLYYSTDKSTWTLVNGPSNATFKMIRVEDVNGDGNQDFYGVTSASVLYYTLDKTTWIKSSSNVSLKMVRRYDRSGDGIKDGWYGLNTSGNLVFRSDADTVWKKWAGTWSDVKATSIEDITGENVFFGQTSSGALLLMTDSNKSLSLPGVTVKEFYNYDKNASGENSDLAILATSGSMSFSDGSPWEWLSNVNSLLSGDFDADGKRNDLAVLGADGYIRYAISGKNWIVKYSPVPLTSVIIGDLDGDGKWDDLIAVGNDYNLYTSSELGAWVKVPASVKQIALFDLDNDGKANNYVAINAKNQLLFKADSGWVNKGGAYKKVIGGDFDKNGFKNDLVLLNTSGIAYKTLDKGVTLTKLSTTAFYDIASIDIDKDGVKNELIALTTKYMPMKTLDQTTWTSAGSSAVYSLSVTDLNGDGYDNDVLGQSSTGSIKYTTDLVTWFDLGGKFKYVVPGDFQDLLNDNGVFVASSGNTAILKEDVVVPKEKLISEVSLKILNTNQLIANVPKGPYSIEIIGVDGTRKSLGDYHSNGVTQSYALPSMKSGIYWLRLNYQGKAYKIPYNPLLR